MSPISHSHSGLCCAGLTADSLFCACCSLDGSFFCLLLLFWLCTEHLGLEVVETGLLTQCLLSHSFQVKVILIQLMPLITLVCKFSILILLWHLHLIINLRSFSLRNEVAITYVKDIQNWRMLDFNVSIMKLKSLKQTNKKQP